MNAHLRPMVFPARKCLPIEINYTKSVPFFRVLLRTFPSKIISWHSKKGCPYPNKLAEEPIMKEFMKCPEFQNNCPFKKATNIREMFEVMSKIPAFTPDHQKWLIEMFKALHSASKGLGECPVFKTSAGCPSSLVLHVWQIPCSYLFSFE